VSIRERIVWGVLVCHFGAGEISIGVAELRSRFPKGTAASRVLGAFPGGRGRGNLPTRRAGLCATAAGVAWSVGVCLETAHKVPGRRLVSVSLTERRPGRRFGVLTGGREDV